MLTKDDEEKAIDLVREFIIQMNLWEKLCNKIEDDNSLAFEQQASKQKDELIKVFDKFCTKKERKNGKPNTISYGIPGSYQYDIEEEKIIDVVREDQKKIAVNTARERPMPEKFIYILIKENDNLLIDLKKRESSWERKWKVFHCKIVDLKVIQAGSILCFRLFYVIQEKLILVQWQCATAPVAV